MRRIGILACVGAALLAATAARADEVDLTLVFAADGSGSIDDDELALQRRGWGEALASPEVLAGIRAGLNGAIAVAYMEWGGPQSQVLIVDWQVIRDEASAQTFARALATRPRGAIGYNSISNAIDFSVKLTETGPHQGLRKVIDVSGDGPNIGGRPLAAARAEALAKGFTINALAISRPGGRAFAGGITLEDYYAQSVIGGPGAFVEVADETRPFATAARRKLLTEIAGAPPPSRHAAARTPSEQAAADRFAARIND